MNDLKETKDKLGKLNIDNTLDDINNKNSVIDNLQKEIQVLTNNQIKNKKIKKFISGINEQS